MIANLIHIYCTYYGFVNYYQRPRCLARESIGIWNHILIFMGLISIVNNFGILLFPSKGIEQLFNNEEEENRIIKVLIIEHVVLFLVFCYYMFSPDSP